MTPSPRDARKTHAYRLLVDQIRGLRQPCHICGWPIDYTITGKANSKHPMGFTLDHLVPLAKGGDLLDPANARAAHRRCNSMKGARELKRVPKQSRRW